MSISVEQIMDCIENPVKLKIIFTLQEKKQSTPRELLAASPKIPQATLYRTLKAMEGSGIIEIISETKVRAVTEKTYALSRDFATMGEKMVTENNGEALYKMFSAFILHLLRQFEQYAKSDSINIENDGLGFHAIPLYATAAELQHYSEQIQQLLAPAAIRTSPDQKLHTFAEIFTPPDLHDSENNTN